MGDSKESGRVVVTSDCIAFLPEKEGGFMIHYEDLVVHAIGSSEEHNGGRPHVYFMTEKEDQPELRLYAGGIEEVNNLYEAINKGSEMNPAEGEACGITGETPDFFEGEFITEHTIADQQKSKAVTE